MAASPSAVILEAPCPQKKSVIVSPFICHEVMGLDGMIFSFLNVEFQARFSLFFTLIKRFFSSSSLSAIRVISSAYLRLLIFLLEILIQACDSSSQHFALMHPVYTLLINKQSDNIQLCHTPFPILNQSVVPCPILTIAS